MMGEVVGTRCCAHTCFQGVIQIADCLNQSSGSVCRYLNPGPPEYGAAVLTMTVAAGQSFGGFEPNDCWQSQVESPGHETFVSARSAVEWSGVGCSLASR
jgi:hypothetical protein